MYKRGDKEFILDMLFACKRIKDYTSGLSFEEFEKDIKTVDAVIRNVEILGEATKNISKSFTEKYKDIEWSYIAKTRDKLIHSYFGVDLEILWEIIYHNIPALTEKLYDIIKKEEWENDL